MGTSGDIIVIPDTAFSCGALADLALAGLALAGLAQAAEEMQTHPQELESKRKTAAASPTEPSSLHFQPAHFTFTHG